MSVFIEISGSFILLIILIEFIVDFYIRNKHKYKD